MKAGAGAVVVEVAALVHGPLEGVVLPAEDVVTVGSGATVIGGDRLANATGKRTERGDGEKKGLPEIHGVDEGVRAVRGPETLVGELGDVPHELEHDLGKLDGVGSGAVAATGGTTEATGSVGDVGLVVDGVEVLAVPAANQIMRISIRRPLKLWQAD